MQYYTYVPSLSFLVFVGGIAYLDWYKKSVLNKVWVQSELFLLQFWTVHAHAHTYLNFPPQMELAFAPGYDPALELAQHSLKQANADVDGELDELDELTFDNQGTEPLTLSGHLRRREQDWIDRIVHGAETGHYYVLLGPKVS